MRRSVPVVVAALFLGLPAAARAGSLDLRGGASFPRADSNLFRDDSELYTVEKDDWIGWTGGIGYNWRLAPKVEFAVHVDGGSRTVHTQYRDFTRPSGREIQQSLELSVVPFGAEVRFVAREGRGEFTPFLSVGADAVFWRYEEFGDFIDFDDPDLPVIPDAFFSEGTTAGFHVAGGFRVPVGDDFNIVAEGRYLWAKADMGEDFRGNEIDLSGVRVTLGINIRF